MKHNLKKISEWLDQEIEHETQPPIYKLKNNDLHLYYKKDDKHILINNNKKISELILFGEYLRSNESVEENYYDKKLIKESNYVQKFKKDKHYNYFQYLNPNTPRYHANMLFNKIIDYCIINKLKNNNGEILIDKSFRNNFYKICYENSFI